jgi:hypothetical protein
MSPHAHDVSVIVADVDLYEIIIQMLRHTCEAEAWHKDAVTVFAATAEVSQAEEFGGHNRADIGARALNE